MTSHRKHRLMGGAFPRASFAAAPLGVATMLRGAIVPHYPDDQPSLDAPAEDSAIDPAAHQRLADAHERLKRDAKADRDRLKAMEDQLAEIQREKDKADEEKAKASGDVEAIKKALEEKHGKELTAKDARIGALEGQLQRLVIDNGLAASLTAERVKPELVKAAAAMLRDGVEIKDEDGEPRAYKAGLPLAEAIKLWATTDEGKAFVLDGNSGGGAGGGVKTAASKNPWKSGTSDFSLTEQDRITKQDPALAKRLMAEAGAA